MDIHAIHLTGAALALCGLSSLRMYRLVMRRLAHSTRATRAAIAGPRPMAVTAPLPCAVPGQAATAAPAAGARPPTSTRT
jgi:hypothetical protein